MKYNTTSGLLLTVLCALCMCTSMLQAQNPFLIPIPQELDYQQLPVGSRQPLTLEVVLQANDGVEIQSSWKVAHSSIFTVDGPTAPFTLTNRSSLKLVLYCQPTKIQEVFDTLIVGGFANAVYVECRVPLHVITVKGIELGTLSTQPGRVEFDTVRMLSTKERSLVLSFMAKDMKNAKLRWTHTDLQHFECIGQDQPVELKDSSSIGLSVRFHSSNVGDYADTLEFTATTKNAEVQLRVPMHARCVEFVEPTVLTCTALSVEFDTVTLRTTKQRSVSVKLAQNTDVGVQCYWSFSKSTPFRASGARQPYLLAQDKELQLTLNFSPDVSGEYRDTLHLIGLLDRDTLRLDVPVHGTGVKNPAINILQAQPSSLDFSDRLINTATQSDVQITLLGIQGVVASCTWSVQSSTVFRLSGHSQPCLLTTSDSLLLHISAIPTEARDYDDTLVVRGAVLGDVIQCRIPLHIRGVVKYPTRIRVTPSVINISALDSGAVLPRQLVLTLDADTSMQVHCSWSMAGDGAFTLLTPTRECTLSTGTPVTVSIQCTARQLGDAFDTLTIISDATITPHIRVPMQVQVIQQASGAGSSGRMRCSRIEATTGSLVDVVIVVDSIAPDLRKNGRDCEVELDFNQTLLVPEVALLRDSTADGRRHVTMRQHIDSWDTLVRMPFLVTLGDAESSVLKATIRMLDADDREIPGQISVDDGSLHITDIWQRGGARLVNPNATGLGLEIRHDNNTRQLAATVTFNSRPVSLIVYDVLGTIVIDAADLLASAHSHDTLYISTSHLPKALYFCRLSSGSSTIVRSFVME